MIIEWTFRTGKQWILHTSNHCDSNKCEYCLHPWRDKVKRLSEIRKTLRWVERVGENDSPTK